MKSSAWCSFDDRWNRSVSSRERPRARAEARKSEEMRRSIGWQFKFEPQYLRTHFELTAPHSIPPSADHSDKCRRPLICQIFRSSLRGKWGRHKECSQIKWELSFPSMQRALVCIAGLQMLVETSFWPPPSKFVGVNWGVLTNFYP